MSEDKVSLLKKALTYVNKEVYEVAIKLLKEALFKGKDEKLDKLILQQLGIVYIRLEDFSTAESYLKRAIKKDDNTEIFDTILWMCEKSGNLALMEEVVLRYLKTNPDDEDLKMKLLNTYFTCEKWDEVEVFLKKCSEENPQEIELKILLAATHIKQHKLELAEEECLQLLEEAEEQNKFRLYKNMYEIYSAKKILSKCRQYVYKAFESDLSKVSSNEVAHLYSSWIFNSLYIDEDMDAGTDADYIMLINNTKKYFDMAYSSIRNSNFENELSMFKPLSVAFLSHDMLKHPVGMFMSSLFKHKNVEKNITYHCYSTNKETDNVTKVIQSTSEKFEDFSKISDYLIEKNILKDKPDILFDMAAHTKGNKLGLFSKRLAPIQITWIGSPSSSGISQMDYTIVDNITDPKGLAEKFYVEKLIHMSKTFLCYGLEVEIPIEGLPYDKNGYITFGCFNNLSKLTDRTLTLWSCILNKVENSKLLFVSPQMKEEKVIVAMNERLVSFGFDLNRVTLEFHKNYKNYFETYNEIDIILDTYPFNGATTTCDALLMGVPLVSLYGRRHVSRVGLSMLTNVSLADLAVPTDEQYIEKAVELSNDVERLRGLRENLRETTEKSSLKDSVSFKIEFNYRMRDVWTDHCIKENGKPNLKMPMADLLNEVLIGSDFIIWKLEDNVRQSKLKLLLKELMVVSTFIISEIKEKHSDNIAIIDFLHKFEKCNNIMEHFKIRSELKEALGILMFYGQKMLQVLETKS